MSDLKALIEAETPFDYILAAASSVGGPVSDTSLLLINKGKSLYKQGKTEEAGEVLREVVRGPYVPNAGAVGNMGEFLKSPGFGSELANFSQKTHKKVGSATVYVANEKINDYIRKVDQFYLDKIHGKHIEVFDSSNKARAVLNMDGSLNEIKTAIAVKQGRRIQK
ncbi:hypothetical protein [Corticibacter populi]|uniref:hypothetical protein n=1 Tax=Corticibacter populi TaxID=1550736 RepID=UPI00102C2A3F|nr:hypothetical protein [Corticibacter populi]